MESNLCNLHKIFTSVCGVCYYILLVLAEYVAISLKIARERDKSNSVDRLYQGVEPLPNKNARFKEYETSLSTIEYFFIWILH